MVVSRWGAKMAPPTTHRGLGAACCAAVAALDDGHARSARHGRFAALARHRRFTALARHRRFAALPCHRRLACRAAHGLDATLATNGRRACVATQGSTRAAGAATRAAGLLRAAC